MKGPDTKPIITERIDGNAFVVMGKVIAALKKNGADKEYIKEYVDKAMSGDYDNLLVISMEEVDFNWEE